jgi:hypothetical protein
LLSSSTGKIIFKIDWPDADLVVLAAEVLHALEVEGLDNTLAAEVVLCAAWEQFNKKLLYCWQA